MVRTLQVATEPRLEPSGIYPRYGKRALDCGLSILLLLLLLPLMVLVFLLVKLTSPGPGIFRQERYGKDEQLFVIYKFRTMFIDQDRRVDVQAIRNKESRGILHKPAKDPRVTPLGRWLRRTSIDELPQILNVLGGDMSLVGPRPLVPFMLDPFPELRRGRCTVRPGITGPWQVSARHKNRTVRDMEEYDLGYIEAVTITRDLMILCRTARAVIAQYGAQKTI